MNMDEIKDKIILAVKEAIANNAGAVDCDYDIIEIDCEDVDHIAEQVADTLIDENIGDVTEWKEKVECAKRILQIPTLPNGTTDLSYFEYKGERIQDIARQRNEYKHRAEVAERALFTACVNLIKDEEDNVNMELLAHVVYTKYLRRAEKELAEEKKDAN